MNYTIFRQGLVVGVLAGFLVLAPIVAREILAEREVNGDEAPSENELIEMIADRVKGKQDEV